MAAEDRDQIPRASGFILPYTRTPLLVAVVYFIVSAVWIAVSDRALAAFVEDPTQITAIQSYKGWAFVLVSALLIYGLIRPPIRRLHAANQRLERALTQLEEAQAHLIQQERLRALQEMAGGIAHDLNNMYGAILGHTELFVDQPERLHNPERVKGALSSINAAARSAGETVQRLKTFYEPSADRPSMDEFNLKELVAEVIRIAQPAWATRARQRGVSVEVETNLQGPDRIYGAAPEIRDALLNLILNAADAMSQDGVVTVSSRLEGDQVVLAVRDPGDGMSEEVRRRCLEPFFTTKGSQGSGLGLAMVYGTVQRHGGAIDIDSQVGAGTTFTLRLPARKGA